MDSAAEVAVVPIKTKKKKKKKRKSKEGGDGGGKRKKARAADAAPSSAAPESPEADAELPELPEPGAAAGGEAAAAAATAAAGTGEPEIQAGACNRTTERDAAAALTAGWLGAGMVQVDGVMSDKVRPATARAAQRPARGDRVVPRRRRRSTRSRCASRRAVASRS